MAESGAAGIVLKLQMADLEQLAAPAGSKSCFPEAARNNYRAFRRMVRAFVNLNGVSEGLIDVWNINTFDDELLNELQLYHQLIKSYMDTESRLFAEYIALDRIKSIQTNAYYEHYTWLIEHIMDYMKSRSIRVWHYTRLSDDEVESIRHSGVHPSTLETTRNRLDARVMTGDFSVDVADALFQASPFQNTEQLAARANIFWMTSNPIKIDDDRVKLLLNNWGGEAVYFWLQDSSLLTIVSNIGKPRVLELAVPINATTRAYSAAEAVLSSFGLALGCSPERGAFDLYCNRPLGPNAVLAIHTEGESSFATLGQG